MSAHKKQIGGNHYKKMAIQPSHYIVKNNLVGMKETLSSMLQDTVLKEVNKI